MYDLQCVFDSRKSFYGKAKNEEYNDGMTKTLKLYSYNTLVALVSYDSLWHKVLYDYLGEFSKTTTRHQKEFFKQNGLNDKEIKELFKNKHLEKEEVLK